MTSYVRTVLQELYGFLFARARVVRDDIGIETGSRSWWVHFEFVSISNRGTMRVVLHNSAALSRKISIRLSQVVLFIVRQVIFLGDAF